MQFTHNPFNKDVDLNTILYRVIYPDHFEDPDLAEEEEMSRDQAIFGHEQDLEAQYSWNYGVDCWRAVYADLATAEEQVQQEVKETGQASAKSAQKLNELKEKFDLCLRVKEDLESTAEDARQGRPVENLILAERSLPAGSKIYFRKSSVSAWTYRKYGISIAEWAKDQATPPEQEDKTNPVDPPRYSPDPSTKWESITIRLLPGNRITFTANGKSLGISDLHGTELLHKRTKALREPGSLLEDLAIETSISAAHSGKESSSRRKAVSILRSTLSELSGISSDPFYKYNPGDGWKPRFELLDRRNAAEERAKEKAKNVPYNDEITADPNGESAEDLSHSDLYPYQDEEGDDATAFLKKHDR
jgi:hypothetical protein